MAHKRKSTPVTLAPAASAANPLLPAYADFSMPAFPDVDKLVVCWGGGVDSTAILCIMKAIGVRPDVIVFSDPGHEQNETYDYIDYFSGVLREWGFPEPVILRRHEVINTKRLETLGEECLRLSTVENKHGKLGAGLPSVAFGRHRCSLKFKAETINRWMSKLPFIHAEMAVGRRIGKIIGYEATETHRSCSQFKDEKENAMCRPIYPLMDWGVDRERAEQIITDMGVRVPPKSACVFCPFAKNHEWHQLANTNPDAFEFCLRMEALARPQVQKPEDFGLHRRGKRGERQLVDWARAEGLTVPNDLDNVPAAQAALDASSQRRREFWSNRTCGSGDVPSMNDPASAVA